MNVRKPAVAGSFYPQSREELDKMIDSFFKNLPVLKIDGDLRALIVPHAGYLYSGLVAAYGYSLLGKSRQFRKVVLLGPSHFAYLEDVVCDSHGSWSTPLGEVIIAENDFKKMSSAHSPEHCLEVQVPFLQKVLKNFEILPLVAGNIDPHEVAKKILPLIDRETLLIISSDLSHYHDYKMALFLDHRTNKAITDLDFEKLKKAGDACGLIPVLALVAIAAKLKWKCRLLHYANSGDVTQDRSGVVGYASFALYD
jgi:AmmeMemoRadiSam system protein B